MIISNRTRHWAFIFICTSHPNQTLLSEVFYIWLLINSYLLLFLLSLVQDKEDFAERVQRAPPPAHLPTCSECDRSQSSQSYQSRNPEQIQFTLHNTSLRSGDIWGDLIRLSSMKRCLFSRKPWYTSPQFCIWRSQLKVVFLYLKVELG